MQLKDISVRSKVLGALCCILVAILLLGSYSVLRLSDLDNKANDIRSNWMLAIGYLGKYQYAATRMRTYHINYILAETDADRASIDSNLASLDAMGKENWAKYLPTVSTDRERGLVAHIESTWAAYSAMVEKEKSMLKSQGKEAAARYSMGAMREAFTNYAQAVQDDIDFNIQSANESAAEGEKTYDNARLWIFVVMGLSVLLCAGTGYVLITGISKPLGAITDAMDELARGRLDVQVPHSDQADEIGKLAGSMASFKNQLAAAERSKAEQVEVIVGSIGAGLAQLAKGDTTHRISAALTGPFAKLKEDFNVAMDRLQDTLKNVLSTTSQISTGAGEISQAADDLSRRTEQQAASLEETAAALEQITATVKKTASNAKEARTSVTTAKVAAEEGGKVVDTAIHAMDGIAQSSKQITDIIGVIDEIAFQTNLLALNAGVEAARAGDAGKGFAVVATEVRALAGRSGEAAKQIKALIHASSEQVHSGVKLVGESGTALRNIVDQVQHINALVTEMAQAAEQQSVGIEQVNAAVSQMDQVTQQNAAMVEQSTAAARTLAGETRNLESLVTFFNVGASSYVSERAPVVRPARPALRSVPKPAAKIARNPARRAGTGSVAAGAIDGDWTEF